MKRKRIEFSPRWGKKRDINVLLNKEKLDAFGCGEASRLFAQASPCNRLSKFCRSAFAERALACANLLDFLQCSPWGVAMGLPLSFSNAAALL